MHNVPLVMMKNGISVLLVAWWVYGPVPDIFYEQATPKKPPNAMIIVKHDGLVCCEEILQ